MIAPRGRLRANRKVRHCTCIACDFSVSRLLNILVAQIIFAVIEDSRFHVCCCSVSREIDRGCTFEVGDYAFLLFWRFFFFVGWAMCVRSLTTGNALQQWCCAWFSSKVVVGVLYDTCCL